MKINYQQINLCHGYFFGKSNLSYKWTHTAATRRSVHAPTGKRLRCLPHKGQFADFVNASV